MKMDWTTKSLPKQCTEMTKAINDMPIKELCDIFPGLVQRVVGSLDGSIAGWSLSSLQDLSSDYNTVLEFLKLSGPMMTLVYKLEVEDYKFDIPVSSLPDPVKASMEGGVYQYSDCCIFSSKSPSNRLSLNAFQYYMLCFATSLTAQNHSSGQNTIFQKSVFFTLVDAYLRHFLPTEGSYSSDVKETMSITEPRPTCTAGNSINKTGKGPLKLQCPVSSDKTNQEKMRSETMLQIFLEIWLPHYPLKGFVPPSEEHMMVVRLLVKHLHGLSGPANPGPDQTAASASDRLHTLPSDDFKRVITSQYVQRLYLLLLHCFNHWPMEMNFRAVLETWLSYIQPWKYHKHIPNESQKPSDQWAPFVHKNLFMYTKLFHCFLKRSAHADLVNKETATMVFRVAKVFAQPCLVDLVKKGENMLKNEQKQRPFLPSSRLVGLESHTEVAVETGAMLKPQTILRDQELRSSHHTLMFEVEVYTEVLKLIQRLMQAQQTTRTMLDQQASFNFLQSLCSWLNIRSTIIQNSTKDTECDVDCGAPGQSCELLQSDFQCQLRLKSMNEESKQLPDCIQREDGLILLTDLGRMQIINELRKFDIEYQGDPQMQPVRSYENAALVYLMFWIARHINKCLEGHMSMLCSRQDLLGRLGHHYLLNCTNRATFPKRAVACQSLDHLRPRLNLRIFASYHTLFTVFLFYILGSLFGVSPFLITWLILMASFLPALFFTVCIGK